MKKNQLIKSPRMDFTINFLAKYIFKQWHKLGLKEA